MNNKLQELLKDNCWNITEEVINEALEYNNPKEFFEQLFQYGCISWMISSLVRYSDTHNFFEKHYNEIQDIRYELENQGIEVKIPKDTDLKNFLAWLSFEETARKVYDILENGE